MPKRGPRKNETEQEWMSYCMADAEMVEEYEDADQRAAVCHSYWSRAQKTADVDIRAFLDVAIVKAKVGLPHQAKIDEMKGVLSKAWNQKSREGIIQGVHLLEVAQGPLTPEFMTSIETFLSSKLGTSYAEAVRDPVFEISEAAYLSGGKEITDTRGVDFTFRAATTVSRCIGPSV